MEIWYISAPLRGDVERNIRRVKDAVEKLKVECEILRIEPPLFFIPHLSIYGQQDDDKWGMKMCCEVVRRCDRLVVIGRKITSGMKDEIMEAEMSEIPVNRREEL